MPRNEGTSAHLPWSRQPVWSDRRLRRVPEAAGFDRSDASGPHAADAAGNLEFVFTRAELQPLFGAIRATLGCGPLPLDSPNRLQDALTVLIEQLDGRGDVVVRLSPAALL